MGQGSQGDRSDTLTGDFVDPGFSDTTAKQSKPSHLLDAINASNVVDPNFGDTTAKQSKPPDVYTSEIATVKGKPLPDIPAKDDAVTIKDSHKKTMQSAVAVDTISSPETKVPSTLDDDDDAPEPNHPKRPRVGPPTLASPGIPQAEWDSAAYPQIANHGGGAPPGPVPTAALPPLATSASNPPPAPHLAPMGYAPPPQHASGSDNYAHAQPRAPLPPTYRVKKEGSGGQVAIILVAIGFCFAIFAAGILMFVSKRMTPAATTRSTPPAEITPGGSASAAGSAPVAPATPTSTTPLQHDQPPTTAAAPPTTTPPKPTASTPPKPGKGPKKGQIQSDR